MITKTLLGIDFFDEYYGGVYRGRPVLVTGRKGIGKTAMGLQFLRQGLHQDECCLMLSTLPANNLDIHAETLGFSLAPHVNAGRLILLEYSRFSAEYGTDMLPPEGFNQLREIIDSHMIQRVLIDTIVPLVAVNPPSRMNEHIYSFMRSFDRLGVTTLMTMPKPVSPMAIRLKNALEAALPVSILLSDAGEEDRFELQVVKYLGAVKLAPPVTCTIKPTAGIVRYSAAPARSPSPEVPAEAAVPKPPAIVSQPVPMKPTLLQDAYAAAGWIGAAKQPAPAPAPGQTQVQSLPPSNGKLRFSAVWSPNAGPKKLRFDKAKLVKS